MQLNQAVPNEDIKLFTRIAIVSQKINDRLDSVNDSILRNVKNYVKSLNKRVLLNVDAHHYEHKKYSCSECSCPNCIYYSLLYNTDAPCIHKILNEKWSNKESLHARYEGKEANIGHVHCELKVIVLDKLLNFEDSDSDERITTERVEIIDKHKYADEHSQLIYECHHLLNMVMDIDQVEVASISMKVQSEIPKKKKYLRT